MRQSLEVHGLQAAFARTKSHRAFTEAKAFTPDFLVLHLDAELLLHAEHELQRVDRIETQTSLRVAEERRLVRDRRGVHLELELADDQLLDSLFQVVWQERTPSRAGPSQKSIRASGPL